MGRTRVAHWRWVLVVIVLAAFALRLHQLGAQSLWYDETVSVYLAGQPVTSLVAHTAGDIHPPGYYLLLKGWLTLFGYPTGHADATGYRLEFVAALLSLVFGLLLVALVFALGRRLYDRSVALVSAALTAVSAFNVWYSQEVRMYTVAATLGLLCLLGVIRFVQAPRVDRPGTGVALRRRRLPLNAALSLYVISAAAGLYVLYYFAFLLVALNLWVLGFAVFERWQATSAARVGRPGRPRRMHLGRVRAWLLAQVVVVVLYIPWLPTAWRQAIDPPVPPWRTFTPMWRMITETWGALSFGQSVEPGRVGPLLVLTAILFGLGLLWPRWRPSGEAEPGRSADHSCLGSLPAVHALLPMVLIFLISLVTPLYHVRYAFTYSPPFALVLAAGLMVLFRTGLPGRLLAVLVLAAMIIASGLSMQRLWTDPAYASDDHRAAARFLSERWRPGDAILVNAGYSYTALLTYFQQPIAWRGRVSEYHSGLDARNGAVVLQTGHIDGDPDLGWGDEQSDFYALPSESAAEKVAQVFAEHPRVWHYRVYDTVNDPEGLIRELLATGGERFEDQLFGGEANMRVEGYLPRQRKPEVPAGARSAFYADSLTLHVAPCCGAVTAGTFLDTVVTWEVVNQPETDYATSLRLVDGAGHVWSQPTDEHPLGSLYGTSRWASGALESQTLRLPVPGDTPPGQYYLELVVYDPASGVPLPVSSAGSGDGLSVIAGSRLRLGGVWVVAADQTTAVECGRAQARFGQIDLLEVSSPAARLAPGDVIPVDLRWCRRHSDAADDYLFVLKLQADDGQVIASAEERPAGGRYPTTEWPAEQAVSDKRQILAPQGAPGGSYQLIVALKRASDGRTLEARRGLLGLIRSEGVVVKTVEVTP